MSLLDISLSCCLVKLLAGKWGKDLNQHILHLVLVIILFYSHIKQQVSQAKFWDLTKLSDEWLTQPFKKEIMRGHETLCCLLLYVAIGHDYHYAKMCWWRSLFYYYCMVVPSMNSLQHPIQLHCCWQGQEVGVNIFAKALDDSKNLTGVLFPPVTI